MATIMKDIIAARNVLLQRQRTAMRANVTTGAKVYLKYTSKSKILLPVTPATINVESPFGLNVIDVAHAGQFTTIGFRGLRSIELSSFFPRHYSSSYCTHKFTKSAEWHRKQVEYYRGKRKPLTLVITHLNISMRVFIEDFSCEYKGGETGDIYFTLKLTEFKAPPSTIIRKKKVAKKKATTKKKKVVKPKPKPRPATTKYSVKKGQTHKVARNETLQKISKKYYGTYNKWRDIYNLNRKAIGANPNRIYVGQKLVIRKK